MAADVESIAARVATGDADALGEAFELFRTSLRQTVSLRMDPRLCSRIDPSDVLQETYCDAVRRLNEYVHQHEEMPLLLWMRLLAMQRLVDLHRRHLGAQMRSATIEISLDRGYCPQASSVSLADQLIDQQETGSQAAMRVEIQQQLRKALDEMEPLDREVLAMRHFESLSNQEVSLALGISPTASSNRYIRALRRLKDALIGAEGTT